jgi:hypothetical protein
LDSVLALPPIFSIKEYILADIRIGILDNGWCIAALVQNAGTSITGQRGIQWSRCSHSLYRQASRQECHRWRPVLLSNRLQVEQET